MRTRIQWPAVAAGAAAGAGIVLLLLLSYRLLPLHERLSLLVGRALVVYLPTGLVAGAFVVRSERRRVPGLTPPAFHALLAGLALAVVHALVLLLFNAGLSPGLEWFFVEATLAASIASVGGLLAGAFLRAYEP